MTSLVEILRRSQAAGFLGPGPVEQHIEQAEAFVAAVPPPASFLDLGSGGGAPGLVLADRWPDTAAVLLDAQLRRVRFLVEAVEVLGFDRRVTVIHGRAEDLAHDSAHRGRYPVVTARSFGAPAETAECGAGFVATDGVLLVAEPPGAPDERWPVDGLATVGLLDDGVVHGPLSSVRRLLGDGSTPTSVPRRAAPRRRSPRF